MTIDREELRRLCEAATPGPWTLETVKTSVGICHKIGNFPSRGAHSTTSACVYADSIHEHGFGHSKVGDELLANAMLISVARAAIPALLDALDALDAAEARERKLREALMTIKTAAGNVVWNAGRCVRAAGSEYDRCWEHVSSTACAALAETAS